MSLFTQTSYTYQKNTKSMNDLTIENYITLNSEAVPHTQFGLFHNFLSITQSQKSQVAIWTLYYMDHIIF